MKTTISRQHFKGAFKTTKYLGSYLTKDMQKHYREKQWNRIEVNFKRQIRGERNPVRESCDARGPSEGGTGVSCRVVPPLPPLLRSLWWLRVPRGAHSVSPMYSGGNWAVANSCHSGRRGRGSHSVTSELPGAERPPGSRSGAGFARCWHQGLSALLSLAVHWPFCSTVSVPCSTCPGIFLASC